MPIVNKAVQDMPALYRRSVLNTAMFAFVQGAKAALHTLTVEQGVLLFMDTYGLTHETYNYRSAVCTFNRMQLELKESVKYEKNGVRIQEGN